MENLGFICNGTCPICNSGIREIKNTELFYCENCENTLKANSDYKLELFDED